MKLTQLFSIFLVSMTFAQFAQAKGTEVGNGGHGVVCRDSSGKVLSVEVLDLYEARTLHGWTLSFGPPTLSYPDKIRIALNRLQKFSPQRATNYQAELNTFESEARFLPGVNLELLPDAANVAVPAGCNLEQIVNQRTPLVPGDPRYIINGDLWNAMSLDQKAALVLHEIVYREMIGYGHKYSISARWLVGWMTSTATLVDCGVAPNEGNPDPSHDCATPQDISFKASMDFYPSGNLKTYWNSGSSLTSNAGPLTSLTLSPYVTVEMLVGDSGNATQNGWLMTDSLPPHLLNLVGSVTLMQTSPSILAANPTSYQLTSDGHIASLTGGTASVGQNFLGFTCGTCRFASDGQISVENGSVKSNFYLSDSVSADSIVVDADQKLIHASGHARYTTMLGSSDDDSSHQQSVQIQANTILMKNDPVASVAADQVTKVEGLSPKGFFARRFGNDFIQEFVATSPAAHIELSNKVKGEFEWSSKDLAFVLPATATNLKSVSGGANHCSSR